MEGNFPVCRGLGVFHYLVRVSFALSHDAVVKALYVHGSDYFLSLLGLMAFGEQEETQTPHPMQRSRLITATPRLFALRNLLCYRLPDCFVVNGTQHVVSLQ